MSLSSSSSPAFSGALATGFAATHARYGANAALTFFHSRRDMLSRSPRTGFTHFSANARIASRCFGLRWSLSGSVLSGSSVTSVMSSGGVKISSTPCSTAASAASASASFASASGSGSASCSGSMPWPLRNASAACTSSERMCPSWLESSSSSVRASKRSPPVGHEIAYQHFRSFGISTFIFCLLIRY